MKLTCTDCSLGKTGCFSGEGPKPATIMIISDRLTTEALNKQQAFSDKAGGEIRQYLMLAGIELNTVYMTNTVKGHVKPNLQVGIVPIRKCHARLEEELQEVKPKVVVLMGATAYKNFHARAVIGTHYYDEDIKAWVLYTHHALKALISGNESAHQEIVEALQLATKLVATPPKNVIVKPQVSVIKDLAGLVEAKEAILKNIEYGVDCETSGLEIGLARLLTIGLSNRVANYGIIFKPEMLPLLNEIFSKIKLIGHNIKFDLQFLRKAGISVANPYYDTLLAHYVIDPLQNHDLKSICLKYLQTSFDKSIDYQELFAKGITETDLYMLAERGTYDAYLSFALKEYFDPIIEKDYKNFFYNVIMKIVSYLAEMEYNGIKIDTEALYATETTLSYQLKALESDLKATPEVKDFILKEGLEEINLASPKQMSTLLYKYLHFPVDPEKGKTTSHDTLEKLNLNEDHPFVTKLLEFRNLAKLRDTYIKGIKEALDRTTEARVHVTYHQTAAITGRLSCSKPNLQTIPKSVDNAKTIRSMFIAQPGYTLVEMDFKQLEFRVWAHLSRDQKMIELIAQGGDIHRRMASWFLHKPEEEITDEERQSAKEISFGLIYGMGVKAMSERCKISIDEATKIKDMFFSLFPDATVWLQMVADFGIKNKFVMTPFGRRLPIEYNPNDNESISSARRHAVNYPVQSAAAELTNLTGVYLMEIAKAVGFEGKLILNVHDALIWEVRDDNVEKFKPLALQAIARVSDQLKFRAYLMASFKKGKNLGSQEDL